jgi:hypothetical protein
VSETEYTGQAIAAMITVPILFLLLLAGSVFLFKKWRGLRAEKLAGEHDEYAVVTPALALTAFIVCAVSAVVAAVGLWWGMYPWKAEYHEWRPVSGVVETVDSRLTAASGNGTMEDKFVVTFEGNPQQYGVLDTRAAGVKPGDRIEITCVRRWQWSGSHGYDCNFVGLEKAGTR